MYTCTYLQIYHPLQYVNEKISQQARTIQNEYISNFKALLAVYFVIYLKSFVIHSCLDWSEIKSLTFFQSENTVYRMTFYSS